MCHRVRIGALLYYPATNVIVVEFESYTGPAFFEGRIQETEKFVDRTNES